MKNDIWNTTTPKQIQERIHKIKSLSLKKFRRGLDLDDPMTPSGAYGVYYRFGMIGIKVLRTDFRFYKDGGYKTICGLKRSHAWQKALEEYDLMKKVEKSKLTPRPFCVKPIRLGNKYFPAIFMEHIDGIRFDFFCEGFSSQDFEKAMKTLKVYESMLTKYGVNHMLDSGGSNAIVVSSVGRKILAVKLIDFSPGLCEEV